MDYGGAHFIIYIRTLLVGILRYYINRISLSEGGKKKKIGTKYAMIHFPMSVYIVAIRIFFFPFFFGSSYTRFIYNFFSFFARSLVRSFILFDFQFIYGNNLFQQMTYMYVYIVYGRYAAYIRVRMQCTCNNTSESGCVYTQSKRERCSFADEKRYNVFARINVYIRVYFIKKITKLVVNVQLTRV